MHIGYTQLTLILKWKWVFSSLRPSFCLPKPRLFLLLSGISLSNKSPMQSLKWASQVSWWARTLQAISVQFSRSVVSDSLRHHESQHARPPCPSPTPGVHSNSCPSSRWCHPAISSSVVPFFSCPQSLPASKSFPMSQLFSWGGQSQIKYVLYNSVVILSNKCNFI